MAFTARAAIAPLILLLLALLPPLASPFFNLPLVPAFLHDQHRLLLQWPLALACLWLLLVGRVAGRVVCWPPDAAAGPWVAPWGVLVLAAIGMASSLWTAHPHLALIEFAQLFGVFLLAVFLGQVLRAQAGHGAHLLHFAPLLAAAFCLAVATGLVAALHLGHPLNPWLLLPGFDNLRFFGQFAAVLLPLIAASFLMLQSQRRRYRWLVFGVLVLWWCVLLMTESRAALLGAGTALLLCALLRPLRQRWLPTLAGSFVLGLLLYLGLFVLLPWLGWVEGASHWGGRIAQTLVSDNPLSGRQVLWAQAWGHALQHPWLGLGPMHFAHGDNPIAAHPHSLPLQLLAEWGVLFTLVLGLLLGSFAWRTLGRLYAQPALHSNGPNAAAPTVAAGALLALASAAAVSLFDGNFVMPYSLLMTALALGFYFSVHPPGSGAHVTAWQQRLAAGLQARLGPAALARCGAVARAATVALLALVGVVAAVGVPLDYALRLPWSTQVFIEEVGGHYRPRLWLQGLFGH